MSDKEIHSGTGGVKPFSIAGRMKTERERLYYRMTEEERQWRAQWLKDQILDPEEAAAQNDQVSQAYYKETRYWFRRINRAPLDAVARFLTPYMVNVIPGNILWIFFGWVLNFFYYFRERKQHGILGFLLEKQCGYVQVF